MPGSNTAQWQEGCELLTLIQWYLEQQHRAEEDLTKEDETNLSQDGDQGGVHHVVQEKTTNNPRKPKMRSMNQT